MERLTPFDWQEKAIERILNEPTRAALCGDDVGQGKTLIGSEVIVRAGWKRFLVIGLRDTFDSQWNARLQAQGGDSMYYMHSDNAEGKRNFARFLAGEPGGYFASIQFLMRQDFSYVETGDIDPKTEKPVRKRKHLMTFRKKMKAPLEAIVFDEADACASHNSVQRRTLLTLSNEETWKIAMSATWSSNSFANAWSLPRWCWPSLIPPYWDWHEEHCEVETKYFGARKIKTVLGEKSPGAFVRSLPLYLKAESEDVAPAPMRVYCDLTPEQTRQQESLRRDFLAWVQDWDGDEAPLVADIPPVLAARLRQVALAELSLAEDGSVTMAPHAASAKLKPLRGLIDGRYAGQQVGIFTDSRIYAQFVADRMRAAGYAAVAYTGDSTPAERKAIKEGFISGEYEYLIGTVQAMGTGLDGLQRIADKVVWLSKPVGNPKLVTQALGRYFRTGRKKGPNGEDSFEQIEIVARDSSDEETLDNLIDKAWKLRQSTGKHVLDAA